jgi:hypothetical protein
MMDRLLRLLAEGGLHSLDGLARILSISPVMLEALLDHLERSDYLRRADAACAGGCSGCGGSCCAVAAPRRLWVLTAKGLTAGAAQKS